MLLPHMWLRKRKLERALRVYPMYDPPHKVEERLLPETLARENFDYFMRVREQRAAFFLGWLERYFSTDGELTEPGVARIIVWIVKYARLLLPENPTRETFFTYEPPWRGRYAGANVMFDLGITLGEYLIVKCPRLHWELGPNLPPNLLLLDKPGQREVIESYTMAKNQTGHDFWRPRLIGYENPLMEIEIIRVVYSFCKHNYTNLYLCDFVKNYGASVLFQNILVTTLQQAQQHYPVGDPSNLCAAIRSAPVIGASKP